MKKILLFMGVVSLFSWRANAQYCTSGGPSSTYDSNVESVSMTGETTSLSYTGCPGVAGVEDQTVQSVDVIAGNSYSLDITFGSCGSYYGGAYSVWFDFDGDQSFSSAELIGSGDFLDSDLPLATTLTVNVPANASNGSHRVRVTQRESGSTPLDPCDSFSWGSVTDFTFEVSGGDCSLPSDLTTVSVANVSADISWTASLGGNDYDIEWGLSGFTPGVGGELGSQTAYASTSTTITGLSPETTYDYYVLANCSQGGGVWVGPVSFTTLPLCPEPTAPASLVGAYDAQLGWTAGGTETMWDVEYGAYGFVLGSGTLDDNIATNPDNVTGLSANTDYHWYVRAVCDLNVGDGVDTVSYWVGPLDFTTDVSCAQPTNFTATAVDTFDVQLDWDAGGLETQWTVEYGMTGFTPGTGTTFTVSTATDTLVEGLNPETTYDFYITANCGVGDDSYTTGPATETTGVACSPVTTLTATNLTLTTADLSWTAGSTETDWTVEYGESGFTLGSGTQVTVTGTPTTSLTGLTEGTTYEYYVMANCTSGDAVWVGPYTFTTVESCPVPTNLSSMNVSTTSGYLLWQAGGTETEWNIEWGLSGFTPGNSEEEGSVSATTDNPYYATGLTPGTTFEYYVQASCSSTDQSEWAGPYTFTTLCDVMTAPYYQYFDDGQDYVPACWTSTDTDDWESSAFSTPDYGVSSAVDHTSGSGYFMWIDGSGSPGIDANGLLSPEIDFSALTSPVVTYWALSNNIDDEAQNTYTMYVTDNGGTTWTELGTYGANSADWVELTYAIPSTVSSPAQFKIVANETAVGGYAFYNDLLVDDFSVDEAPVCTAEAGTAVGGSVCATDGANGVNLFDAITGYSDGNGTWYYPSATSPSQSFAASNGDMTLTGMTEGVDYTFDYVVGTGVCADTVSVVFNWSEAPAAGGDGTATTCVSQDVVLVQELTGTVEFGGDWIDLDGATGLVNGIFYTGAVAPGTYNFAYVVSNGSCTDTANVEVTVESCLGVEENTTSSLEVYPNPVKDELTIANLTVEGNATIRIVDLQGKVVYTSVVSDQAGNYTLDVSKYENGVYVVEVISANSTQQVRVVKQ